MPQNIPKAMPEKFAAITTLVDDFAAQHLNEDYRQAIHRGSANRLKP